MNIRVGKAEDLGAIISLERQSPTAAHWPESFYRGLFEAGAVGRVALVVEQEDELRGFLIARISSGECELENVAVADGSQRRGVASSLIVALIAMAREQDVFRVFLEVRESNAVARGLYEKCGFAINGRRVSYYADPKEDAILYTLKL